MQYDFSRGDAEWRRFVVRANYLHHKGSVVDLTEKAFKTPRQNRYLHLLIGVVAMECGVTLEYAKREYFKRLVNPGIFCVKVRDRFLGEQEDLLSITRIPKEKISEAIDRFKMWGSENGIYLPGEDDLESLRQIELEMQRNTLYLGDIR